MLQKCLVPDHIYNILIFIFILIVSHTFFLSRSFILSRKDLLSLDNFSPKTQETYYTTHFCFLSAQTGIWMEFVWNAQSRCEVISVMKAGRVSITRRNHWVIRGQASPAFVDGQRAFECTGPHGPIYLNSPTRLCLNNLALCEAYWLIGSAFKLVVWNTLA